MTQLLGVDVSSWQPPNLPWQAWRAFGVRFAYIRHGLGYVGDRGAEKHREYARAAGLYTGAYFLIMKRDAEIAHFDPVQSARAFDRLIQPGDEMPPMVDVEALGVNAGLLNAFLNEFDRLRPNSGVGIYTSRYFWNEIGGTGLIGADHYEFAHRPLWVAHYGNPQDPPRLPDIWRQKGYVCYQFRYKKGYLPGYADDLDINLWSGDDPMPTNDDQLKGLLAEANSIQEDANVLIAAGKAMQAKAADMSRQLADMIGTPPPPTDKHTMADKTNNEVFTLFKKAFGDSYFAVVKAALDEDYMLAHRTDKYNQAAIEDLPGLSAAQKAALIAALA